MPSQAKLGCRLRMTCASGVMTGAIVLLSADERPAETRPSISNSPSQHLHTPLYGEDGCCNCTLCVWQRQDGEIIVIAILFCPLLALLHGHEFTGHCCHWRGHSQEAAQGVATCLLGMQEEENSSRFTYRYSLQSQPHGVWTGEGG